MSQGRSPAALSVIVVSDYEAAAGKTWHDERLVLRALADQRIGEPFEVVLVENVKFRDTAPADLHAICTGLRIVWSPEGQSARLKDEGVTHAVGDLVAVIEADSVPSPTWLATLVAALRAHPEVSAASGRTTYGDATAYERVLSVLDRGFDDPGHAAVTAHVANNGAVYRRSILEAFRYPDAVTPFASARMRLAEMRRSGHRFFFEPRAVMRHAIGGWRFVLDFRRNTGGSDMLGHRPMRYRVILPLLARRLRAEWSDCRRLGRRYLRWYDWPLALLLVLALRLFEIPGMVDAIRGRGKLGRTAYH